MHSSRQEKHKVLIKLSRKDFLLEIFYRIAHSTSWNLIQLLKSHSKEIWQWEALQVNATGGSSSLMKIHHRSLEGYCENILQGRVTVELWVGQCPSGHILGDAYTGYQSISRIMIEEVSRAQSWLARSSSPEGKSRIFAFSFIHHFRFHNILIFFIPPKNWSHSLSQVLFCPNNVQCYEVSFLPI